MYLNARFELKVVWEKRWKFYWDL